MGLIHVPSWGKKQKPPAGTPLNSSHPLASKLNIALPLNDAISGSQILPRDHGMWSPIATQNFTWVTDTPGWFWTMTDKGPAMHFPVNTDDIRTSVNSGDPDTLYTRGSLFTIVRSNLASTVQAVFGGHSGRFQLQLHSGGSIIPKFLHSSGSFGAWAANEWTVIGVEWEPSGANTITRGYQDGQRLNEVSATSGTTNNQMFRLGNDSVTNNGLQGDIFCFYLWNRLIGDGWHRALAENPFCMFEHIQVPIFKPTTTSKTSSGAPSLPLLTASGTSVVERSATGSPTLPLLTAAGTAENIHTSSGTPSLPLLQAAGAAEVVKISSGSPTIPLLTASGAAEVVKTSSGSPSLPLLTATGTSSLKRSASGAPSLPLLTASGVAEVNKIASGAPSLPLLIANGAAGISRSASGSPSLPLLIASGVATVGIIASGAPSLPLLQAAGIATDTSAGPTLEQRIEDLESIVYAQIGL